MSFFQSFNEFSNLRFSPTALNAKPFSVCRSEHSVTGKLAVNSSFAGLHRFDLLGGVVIRNALAVGKRGCDAANDRDDESESVHGGSIIRGSR